MKVAIIILNYNSLEDCKKCISHLQRQKGVDVDIVVVDNHSTKVDEKEIVRRFCKENNCTFIESKENRGYNAGNNIGLKYAAKNGYQYALIANPDMEFPQTDYVARLVEQMEKDEDIAVCGSDIVTPEGIHQNPMKRDGDWKSSFGWITSFFAKKNNDTYDFIDDYKNTHYCAKVSGCCLMIRLSFFESINFFDENVFLYCEEAILSKQVENAGKKMYYLAETQALHRHIKNEKGDPVRRFKTWKNSRIYYIKKYSGDSSIGKQIAILSMSLYIYMFIFVKFIRRLFR